MLTKLTLRNFKRFEQAEIELGDAVVFIGPNNSGKTSALQALSLWQVGLSRWLSKRSGSKAKERTGVTVNRRDLLTLPVPSGRLLWHDLNVRSVVRLNGKPDTSNVLLEVVVEGIDHGKLWKCGLEFDYANEESFYVRPLHDDAGEGRLPVPTQAGGVKMAYMPPMSGLAADEFIKQSGEIEFLIGQGQTAQVLRNLCYLVCNPGAGSNIPPDAWRTIGECIAKMFGASLHEPVFIEARSEITMSYTDRYAQGKELDISAAGRGLQQTLLLLTYIFANPGAVLLLDEPDAHLEVLRQRHVFQLIRDIARSQDAQIIAASHSEVVLNEAATTGKVVAFVGKPHTISDKTSQIVKSLTTIGWDQYYEAELNGWVLYVEEATDLAILKSFARLLNHPVSEYLSACYVDYVATNLPQIARDRFYGLREAKPDLVGIALFDRLDKQLQSTDALHEMMWGRREIENYFCTEQVLKRWARRNEGRDLFAVVDAADMDQAITEITDALRTLGIDPWGPDVKASDDVLDRIFRRFYELQNLPIEFRKSRYYDLVDMLNPTEVDLEVKEKLDAILAVAKRARPPQ